jgi:hypothetical protein
VTDTADAIRPPRTIVAAFVATIAAVVLSVLSAALWWAYQEYLRNEFYKNNNNLKAGDKNKKTDYDINTASGLKNINHDVHNWLTSSLIQSLIFGLALVLIAVNMRRGKSWARWLLLILFAIPLLPTAAPYRLLSIAGSAPALTRVAGALTGVVGLAVIVLLFVPESTRYFAAVRAEQLGDRDQSAAPTGLRGLFMPRPPGAGAPGSTDTPTSSSTKPTLPEKPVAARPARTAATASTAKQTKAKVRASADAEPSSSPTARPASSVAAKSRSKSRKGS